MFNEKVILRNTVKNPWLIQRCQIKEKPAVNKTLSQCLRFEYMGSAEFEWGSLPRNTEALYQKRNQLTVSSYAGPLPKGVKKLFILSLPEQAEDYQKVLSALVENQINTKEYVFSSFGDQETDLWMDLDNQVVFSSDKNFLEKISYLLEGSMKKIERNKKVKEAGDELLQSSLNQFYKELPGTVALVAHAVEENEGTKSLKDKTQHDIVFWLNGPQGKKGWVCGFFTVEDLQEFIANKTGRVQEVVNQK